MSDNPYRKLGGQTIIYGFGTIIPRVLNYIVLTAYYTRRLEVQQYGIITELYAYIAIFLVIMTFGLETGFFKFYLSKDKDKLFSSIAILLFSTSLIFITGGIIFSGKISEVIQYKNYPEYVKWAMAIVGIDALTNIFIAKLRIEEKIKKFVIVQLFNVFLTIVLVLFFFEILPKLNTTANHLFLLNYLQGLNRVYLIFLANFIASGVRLFILFSEMKGIRIKFDSYLIKEILIYSLPLLLAQLSGIFNESVDRIMLRHFLPEGTDKLYEIGIYGANFRIAMLMTIFIQMFRYAADPFYFSSYNDKNSIKIYADVFKYFVIFCMIIFLLIMLYIHYFKFFIDSKYHSGLYIVPVILFSSFMTGVLFNLNIWYRLTGKTYYGIYIIGTGAVVTFILNALLIPGMGYYGCAITRLVSSTIMVLLSYLAGKRFFKVPYDLRKVFLYIIFAIAIYVFNKYFTSKMLLINTLKNTLFFGGFIYYLVRKEKLLDIFILKKYENKNTKQV